MKHLLLTFAASSLSLSALSTTAAAASWRSINERQEILEDRINQGIRSGALTRPEVIRLRSEYNDLARLKDRIADQAAA